MKGQEDFYRAISNARTKWSFGAYMKVGGGIFPKPIMKGFLIHMGHCEILSHLSLQPSGDISHLSWKLHEVIATSGPAGHWDVRKIT